MINVITTAALMVAFSLTGCTAERHADLAAESVS